MWLRLVARPDARVELTRFGGHRFDAVCKATNRRTAVKAGHVLSRIALQLCTSEASVSFGRRPLRGRPCPIVPLPGQPNCLAAGTVMDRKMASELPTYRSGRPGSNRHGQLGRL